MHHQKNRRGELIFDQNCPLCVTHLSHLQKQPPNARAPLSDTEIELLKALKELVYTVEFEVGQEANECLARARQVIKKVTGEK